MEEVLTPSVVLALLDRIKALENTLKDALTCELGWEDTSWGPRASELLALNK